MSGCGATMSSDAVFMRYRGQSCADDGAIRLSTFTAGAEGDAATPYFFDGDIERPDVVAAGILAVAQVAGSRHYVHPSATAAAIRAADPVITCDGARLRFESFSLCCGIHARLDVHPEGLVSAFAARGTTNIDVNPDLRKALSRQTAGGALHLRVGDDEVVTSTLDGTVVEKRVPLPVRWLKGFGEAQRLEASFGARISLSPMQARTFLQSLSRAARGGMWISQARAGVQVVARPIAGAVHVSGGGRLETLAGLVRLATSVTVYGPPMAEGMKAGASAWVLDLPGATYTLLLSPTPDRAFSGEGGLLASSNSEDAIALAASIGPLLATVPVLSQHDAAAQLAVSADDASAALDVLAVGGLVGHDLVLGGFFDRRLPYGNDRLDALQPRLARAQRIDSVTFDDAASRRATVVTPNGPSVVHLPETGVVGSSCTCAWWGRHRGERGPCAHVLAADAARRTTR
jgi:hypothetical protein